MQVKEVFNLLTRAYATAAGGSYAATEMRAEAAARKFLNIRRCVVRLTQAHATIAMQDFAGGEAVAQQKRDRLRDLLRLARAADRRAAGDAGQDSGALLPRQVVPPGRIDDTRRDG